MPGGLPQPGDVLAGKYDIIRVLGLGGMGIVLEAMHTRLSQRVAIKCLLPAMLEDPRNIQRFDREARAVARLRSRYVVRVIDVESTPEGLPYMVMEMLHGNDLARELQARPRLPAIELVDYSLQICSALAEACDAGITHRDLKPSNIYLCEEPEGRIAKVLDFGIATTNAMASQGSGTIVGTPHYMSPEQLQDTENVGPQSDLWALGVIMYEALAGSCPFDAKTYPALTIAITRSAPTPLSQLRTDLPPTLCDVIMGTLEKEPSRRYPDARTLAEALYPFGSRRDPFPSQRSTPRTEVVVITGERHSGFANTVAIENSDGTRKPSPETRSTEAISVPQPVAPGPRTPATPMRRRAIVGAVLLFACGAAAMAALYARPSPSASGAGSVSTSAASRSETAEVSVSASTVLPSPHPPPSSVVLSAPSSPAPVASALVASAPVASAPVPKVAASSVAAKPSSLAVPAPVAAPVAAPRPVASAPAPYIPSHL